MTNKNITHLALRSIETEIFQLCKANTAQRSKYEIDDPEYSENLSLCCKKSIIYWEIFQLCSKIFHSIENSDTAAEHNA